MFRRRNLVSQGIQPLTFRIFIHLHEVTFYQCNKFFVIGKAMEKSEPELSTSKQSKNGHEGSDAAGTYFHALHRLFCTFH